MKSSKCQRFFVQIVVIVGLIFSLTALPRWLTPGSFVFVESPAGSGNLLIDGKFISQPDQPIFLPPGNHQLELRLTWHAVYRLQFTTLGTWLPIGIESVIFCQPVCLDPESTLVDALQAFAKANSPWFSLPQLSFARHGLELAAQAIRRTPTAQAPKISKLTELWLAQAWQLCASPQSNREVLAASSYISGGSQCSPFGPSYLLIATFKSLMGPAKAHIPGSLITQADWMVFLDGNPQWSPRQRPALARSGLVDRGYLLDYESTVNQADLRNTPAWRQTAIRGISLPAAQAYAKWLSKRNGQAYRLPTALEQENLPWAKVTGMEWTSNVWQSRNIRIKSAEIWKLPYCIASQSEPTGKIRQIWLPRQSSSASLGFRLVQQTVE